MKITRMYLENFIGIYAGTGRTQLDVDFTKGDNQIIVLSGKNGSGKSTFMSLCHPLRGTLDNRSDIIIPGELGHSICEMILDDGRKCVTEHYYGKKNKSFISVDGKELNENGSIRQFEVLAKEVLGIDADYFRIGKLGSNVSNFIDLSTTQRKSYLNQFIPAVDDYLEAFEIVKEKCKAVNTQIKLINSTIEKYSKLRELPEIKNHLTELENNLSYNEKELLKVEKKIGTLQDKRDEYTEDVEKIVRSSKNEEFLKRLEELDLDDPETKMENIGEFLDDESLSVDKIVSSYQTKIDAFLEKHHVYSDDPLKAINGLLQKNIAKKTEISSQIKNLTKELDRISNEIISVNNELKSYERKFKSKNELSSEDIDSLKSDISRYKKEIKLLGTANAMLMNRHDEDTLNGVMEIDDAVSMIRQAINNLVDSLEAIKDETEFEILNKYPNLPTKDKLSSEIFKNEKRVDELKAYLETNKTALNKITSQVNFVKDNLAKRPENCKNDSCSFIESSIRFQKEEYPKISEYEKNISDINDELLVLEEKLNKDNNTLAFIKSMEKLFNVFSNNLGDITEVIHIDECINDFKKTIFDHADIEESFMIVLLRDCIEYIKNTENKNNLESQVDILETKIDNFNESKKLADEYEELISSFNDKLINLDLDKKKVMSEIADLEPEDNKTQVRINKCEAFINSYEELSSYKNLKDEINSIIERVQDKFDKINSLGSDEELQEKKTTLAKMIKATKEEIDDTKASIRIIEDSLEKLKEIEEINESMELVKGALDPKSGIPLLFINSFLTNISQKANKLLKLAYDDSFLIHFDVTAKDFKIEVYKSDGTVLKDINEGSQGEQSLTSTSLSLAMIESVIKPGFFNVIYLDEIDATLSTENRRIFIEILEKQLKELGCQQCFVITHNNEFYNHDVDLILFNEHDCDLNDKDFMKGKKVLMNLN